MFAKGAVALALFAAAVIPKAEAIQIFWFPKQYAPIASSPEGPYGKYEFLWQSNPNGHNVWKMPNKEAFDNCDFTNAQLVGTGGRYVADGEEWGGGTHYFACSIGDHCSRGMKIQLGFSGPVKTTQTPSPTPNPTPNPTPPPTPSPVVEVDTTPATPPPTPNPTPSPTPPPTPSPVVEVDSTPPEVPGPKIPPPKEKPSVEKDCACEKYLKADAWKYLKYNGITLSDFCCQVGFVNSCYGYGTASYLDGVDQETTPGAAAVEPGYHSPARIDHQLSGCIKKSGLDKIGHKYPEKHRIKQQGASYGDGDGGKTSVSGYYQKPCYWTKDYYSYIACVFAYHLKEAVSACYCYYRTQVHCECDDCTDDEDGAKDIKLDRKVAYNDPEVVCNQCPKKKHDDGGYGSYKPYGGGYQQPSYGYGSYLEGTSYDECAGYCYLIEPYKVISD